MSLMDDFTSACVLMEKTRKSDGEGGFVTEWAEGAELNAAITFDSSMQAREAEQAGVTSLYTVTVPKDAGLKYHDILKRRSDGKVFRVTSDGDDVITPARASFQFSQVTAEEWKLT